jgi:tetratricopeptide (TPR) repeat protein
MEFLKYVLRTIVFFALASIILFPSSGHCIGRNDMHRIKTFVDNEYNKIASLLKETKEMKDKVWAEGDIGYFRKWLKGLQHERKGEYQSAIKWYQEASKVHRYEMSSYNVSLPLGRAFLLSNQRQNALKALRYFIERAEAEPATLVRNYLYTVGIVYPPVRNVCH